MKIFLILVGCILGFIPVVQSLSLIFGLKRWYFGEEVYDRRNRYHVLRRGSYRYFFWNIRRIHSKPHRVIDWFTLFVLWGYIPYLLGEVMQGLYRLWRQI